jgi:hypothetical protein
VGKVIPRAFSMDEVDRMDKMNEKDDDNRTGVPHSSAVGYVNDT